MIKEKPKATTAKVATPKSTIFTKPEAKVLSVPTGKLNTSNLSIKESLKSVDTKEQIQTTNIKNAVF